MGGLAAQGSSAHPWVVIRSLCESLHLTTIILTQGQGGVTVCSCVSRVPPPPRVHRGRPKPLWLLCPGLPFPLMTPAHWPKEAEGGGRGRGAFQSPRELFRVKKRHQSRMDKTAGTRYPSSGLTLGLSSWVRRSLNREQSIRKEAVWSARSLLRVKQGWRGQSQPNSGRAEGLPALGPPGEVALGCVLCLLLLARSELLYLDPVTETP